MMLNQLLKQRFLEFSRATHAMHLYRVFVRASLVSFIYRFKFFRSYVKRLSDYLYTYKKYRELDKKIDISIKKKNARKAWNRGDYLLSLELIFKIIFYWPIYCVDKLMMFYATIKLSIIKIYKKYVQL
tara:strand:- start:287 stop:670 length:384 start_codon:yes stop_codon:yes gene_type:complete